MNILITFTHKENITITNKYIQTHPSAYTNVNEEQSVMRWKFCALFSPTHPWNYPNFCKPKTYPYIKPIYLIFIFSHFRTEYLNSEDMPCLCVCLAVWLSGCLSRWIFSTNFVRFWWKCTQMILTKIWDDTFFIFFQIFVLMTS